MGCPGKSERLRRYVWRTLDEGEEIGFQSAAAVLGKFDEAKGLEPSLSRPHGEQNFCIFVDGGGAEVKDQFHLQLFVEWSFEMNQAAGDGKLMEFTANLAVVGKANEGQDGATQFHAKGALRACRRRCS